MVLSLPRRLLRAGSRGFHYYVAVCHFCVALRLCRLLCQDDDFEVLASTVDQLCSVLVALRQRSGESRMEALSVYANGLCDLMDRDNVVNSWRLQVRLCPLGGGGGDVTAPDPPRPLPLLACMSVCRCRRGGLLGGLWSAVAEYRFEYWPAFD